MQKIKRGLKHTFSCTCIAVFLFLSPTNAQDLYNHETGLNTLVFSKQQQLQLGFFIHTIQFQGGKFLIGYSPLKHLSIEGGYIKTNPKYHSINGNTYTANLGFYHNLNLAKQSEKVVSVHKKAVLNFNFKLGYTYGNINSDINRFQTDFASQKFYTQVGIGIENRMFGINLFLKYNRVNFLEGEVARAETNHALLENVRELEKYDFINMMEYKVKVHCGYGYIKGFLGMSLEMNYNKERDLDFLEEGYPYFGLIWELNTTRKKSK